MPGRTGQSGRRRKTLEEHYRDGTYNATRHRHLLPKKETVKLYYKPQPQSKKPVAKKWIRDASDVEAIEQGCWFDARLGKYACDWIERFLKLTEGIWYGKPFTLMDWQRDMLMRLFGWIRWDDEWKQHVRRFDRAYVHVPKKNAKSPTAAAVSLYMLAGDAPHGSKCFAAAVDAPQARIVGNHVFRMVRADEHLKDQIHINEHGGKAHMREVESEFRVLSGDAYRQEGLNASCVTIDELHAHKDPRLFDALRWAGVSRPDRLLFMITTAGSDKASLCYQQYEYAKGVLAGTISDVGMLPIICEADDQDDWTDPAVWRKANPSMGTTLQMTEMAHACKEAQQSPRLAPAFKRYRLNLWTNPDEAWLNLADWEACLERFHMRDLAGQRCIMGLDLSLVHDLTSAVLMFFDEDEDVYRQLPFFWIPEETVKRRQHLAGYQGWIDSGELTVTEGDVCDYSKVFDDIAELCSIFDVVAVGYDPYRAEPITRRIEEELGVQRVSIAQTIKNLAPASAEYERRVLNQTLRHNGNKLLAWQAGHVLVRTDTNQNLRPIKPKKTDHRTVDGIVAGVMAMAMYLEQPEPVPTRDYYDANELELI